MKKIYLSLLLLMLGSPALMAQIYVTETGAGNKDGTSWINAYDNTQLQIAINSATAGQQVWVAKGTYRPTEYLSTVFYDGRTAGNLLLDPATDSDKSFILKTGVAIYGGFAGTETAINQRTDITTTNETILSGDLNNSSTADAGDAYHIVATRDDADGSLLDGFTIKHGYSNDANYAEITGDRVRRNLGSALAVFTTKTVNFSNLVIKDNITTNAGGAVFSYAKHGDARINFTNVLFQNNQASGSGAVIYHTAELGDSQMNITNCVFENNLTTGIGGAIWYSTADGASQLNITGSNFKNNQAGGGTGGGAVYFAGASNTAILNITNSNFENNLVSHVASTYGGAIRVSTGFANIVNTTFKGNGFTGTGVDGTGGAIYSTGSSTVTITGGVFDGNSSNDGGHYNIYNGQATILNVTFKNGNSAGPAGALSVGSRVVYASITQCDFISNTATGAGGAISALSNVNISKSRFFNNTATGRGGALTLSTGTTFPNVISTINNSLFYNNVSNDAANGGGIMYLTRANSPQTNKLTVTNNTFYANQSPNGTWGALSFFNNNQVTLNLYNNIFNGNSDKNGSADLRMDNGGILNFSNNLFQMYNLASNGNDNIVNPYYLNTSTPEPLFASTTATDYNFLWPVQGGFGLDKGDNTLYTNNVNDINTATDLLGNPRANGTIDLGAIEWSTVMPVKVSSFTANLVNGRTQLKWSVGTEENVNRYEIERSQNGADFTAVVSVNANALASYQTTDNNPQAGNNYYRLVTVDNDGSRAVYGTIRVVKVGSLSAQSVQIYPNPIKGSEVKVSLDSPAGTYSYRITNTSGNVVQQGSIVYDGTVANIKLSPAVGQGVYVLYFSNGAQAKLIKR